MDKRKIFDELPTLLYKFKVLYNINLFLNMKGYKIMNLANKLTIFRMILVPILVIVRIFRRVRSYIRRMAWNIINIYNNEYYFYYCINNR